MNHSIIADLLIAAIVLLSLYLGWKKGIVRGLLALLATILAIMAASMIADYTADLVIERFIRPAAYEAMEQRISELDLDEVVIAPREEIGHVIESIPNELVREKALELLASAELPTDSWEDAAGDAVLTASGELVDAVLFGAVRALVCAILCLVCFLLISLALRPIQKMIEEAFELPILRQVNQLGGLLSGAVKGTLLVLVAVWVLYTADILLTDEMIANSYLLKYAVSFLQSIGLLPS